MTPQKRYLSPIELLIAVLVFGIAAALGLPAAKQAGETSDLLECRSNLYEIGQAIFLYASDHDGQLPSNMDFATWGTYAVDRSFGLLLAEAHGGRGTGDYIGRPHDLLCPSLDPALFELDLGFKRPDEINQDNPLERIGYIWFFYPAGDRRSNASVVDDPHRPLAFDLTVPLASFGRRYPRNSHPDAHNVLHLGGHVNTVTAEGVENNANIDELYEWLTEESRGAPVQPLAGGNDQ